MRRIEQIKAIIKKLAYVFKETFTEFIDDNGLKLSAALSYYTIFSMPPLLIIIIAVCGFFFGAKAVQGEIFWQVQGIVGKDAALQIQDIIKNVKLSDGSAFATMVSLIILLIGGAGVFAEIQDSINFIWGIEAKPKRGLFKFFKNRLTSFSMIGSAGFLLMVGLVINSVTDVLYGRLAAHFPKDAIWLFYVSNVLLVFIITTLLFAVIFRTLPDGRIVLRDCIIGASFTAFLFMIGKFVIGAYLGSSLFASFWGTAGSIIVILAWVYYSAIILYFGAEFTKVYAHNHGDKITPYSYSVRILKPKILPEAE